MPRESKVEQLRTRRNGWGEPEVGKESRGQGLNRVTKSSRWVQRPVRTDKGRSWLTLQPSPHDLIPQQRDGASKTLDQLKGQLVLSGQRGSFLQAEKLALCPKWGGSGLCCPFPCLA